jgi:hypothetical protein
VSKLHFFVNPIAMGRAESAFREIERWQPLTLRKAVPLPSGVVLLQYDEA